MMPNPLDTRRELHILCDIPNVRYFRMSNPNHTVSVILGAAERLFADRNYADVSMRDIAAQARVSTGALYHHYPSKDQLYYAMLTAYLARVRQTMLEAIQAPSHTASPDPRAYRPRGDASHRRSACRARLRALTGAFLRMPPVQRQLMRLVRRDLNVFRGKTRAGIVRAYQQAVPNLVQDILAAGMREGEVRRQDERWLAWAYVALIETILTRYAEEQLGDVDARLDAALDLFFEGASTATT